MKPGQSKIKKLKLFEPVNREELLRGWLLHAHKGRDRHDLAARRNETYRYWLGVPTIILSAIVGTSVFASLDTQVDSSLKIILGLVSITSAVLASLQTFYNFANLAEGHRVAGVKYKILIWELEETLTQSLKQLPDNPEYFDNLRKRLEDLELGAPVVPEGIYQQVEDRYDNVVFADTAISLTR